MTITVEINTNSAAGQKLVAELRRHPNIVKFLEPDQVAEPMPEGYVSLKEGFDEAENQITINSDLEIESLPVKESAKLAFDRLGEKYECSFDNKYTR